MAVSSFAVEVVTQWLDTSTQLPDRRPRPNLLTAIFVSLSKCRASLGRLYCAHPSFIWYLIGSRYIVHTLLRTEESGLYWQGTYFCGSFDHFRMQERKSATDDCQHSEDKNTRVTTESFGLFCSYQEKLKICIEFSAHLLFTHNKWTYKFFHMKRDQKSKRSSMFCTCVVSPRSFTHFHLKWLLFMTLSVYYL